MKKITLLTIITSTILNLSAQQVNWTCSTSTENWKVTTISLTNANSKTKDVTVVIYPEQKLQKMDGFGGCFNELGWDALQAIAPSVRSKIMQELFSNDGANFSICRMPIGSSDYAMSYYSLDDVADDFSMLNFNIDRDRYILIPYIKMAQQVHPDLNLWASPWCPPYWMKTNNHYASKDEDQGQKNDLSSQRITVPNATAFRMQEGYLKSYALYFSKFLKAYGTEGISISAIHVQNEPLAQQSFPSCIWRAEDLCIFIGQYLGPQLAKTNPNVEIWYGTINNGDPDYIRKALNDTEAAKYIKGVGFQWDGKNAIPFISKEYPAVKMMQTESECGDGSNDWKAAEHTWSLMNHYISNGANSYMYWNMVLDQSGSSRWGWVQNALISINKQTKQVVYNPEFYLMKQLSHYVKPGANRLKTNHSKDQLAFVNPDGGIVLLYTNAENTDKTLKVLVGKKTFSTSIKAHSFNTFCF